jgi:four helix bundle protein
VSIGANIVEGSARASKADYVRFLSIAFASAREMQYELSIAARLGYLGDDQRKHLEVLAARTCGTLYGLIKALRKAISS